MGLIEDVAKAREGELTRLIEELAGCRDSRQVLVASTRCSQKWFPGHSFFGLLLSDQTGHHWRFIQIKNSDSITSHGVDVTALPSGEAIDPILALMGTDVSLAVAESDLLDVLSGDANVLSLKEGTNLDTLQRALKFSATSLIGARWQRPRGGIGWIFLGYSEPIEFAEADIEFFATIVRVTVRMAIYPEMIHEVEMSERIGSSLRRNIVHDLKTPLTVIRGFAQTLLLPGVADDPKMQRELLTGIVEQTDRLLDDLKDILMPLDDAWRPQPEEFDLTVVLQQAIIAERHTERAKHHRIQIEGGQDKCIVYLDRRKIRRVIENLVSNAVKYSPGSGKNITVIVKAKGDVVSISFQDEGIGMTEAQLSKVLSDGGRVGDRNHGIEGSGFGLDSCQRVLEAHGGRLEAVSTPGKGSAFTAVFPKRIKI